MPANELGYGDVDARPDGDGGEPGGGARPEPVATNDGKGAPGGQTDPAYRGGDNPKATRGPKPAASTASGFVAGGPAEPD